MKLLHKEITDLSIKAFFNVYNQLGYCFLERVYENAMMIELRKLGLNTVKQFPISVYYDEEKVGDYFADIVVERKVILELKSASSLVEEHEMQLLNYLKATKIEVGLLLNFGAIPQFQRKVFENRFK